MKKTMLFAATLIISQFQFAPASASYNLPNSHSDSGNSEIDPVALTRLGDSIKYPDFAQSHGIEGRVILVALIDTFGNVTQVRCKESTDRVFNDAAIAAMMKMHYLPARDYGKAVKVWLEMPIHFTLKGLPKAPVVRDGTPGLG